MPRGEGNPQLEDGFARIAWEILDAIARIPLSDYESRCIHYLWRQTYGWKDQSGQAKKADRISYGQWAEATNISRRNVIRTLNMLVERQIIHKRELPNFRQAEWAFNKHWGEWVVDLVVIFNLRRKAWGESNKVVSPRTLSRLEKATEVVSPRTPSKAKSDEVVSPRTPSVVSARTPSVVSPRTPTIDRLTIDRLTISSSIGADDLPKFLRGLRGWSAWDEGDGKWITDLMQRYPEFNLDLMKKCVDYYSGRPEAKHKGTWKNRIVNWCEKTRQFAIERAEREKERPARRGPARPGRVPTGEELKEQMRRYGIGQQDEDTGDL